MTHAFQTPLRQVVYALSDALDLVGVDDVAHGKRVGVMAAECAKVLGWSQDDVLNLFDLGLLHDIGVSNTATHRHLVEEFDWAGSQGHAELGYRLLRHFSPLAHMALPIRYHHTRWELLQEQGVSCPVALQANLILLVDRVDAMAAPHLATGVLRHTVTIRAEIQKREGTYFSPELVAAFSKASLHEAFWLSLEPSALANYLHDMAQLGSAQLASNEDLLGLARIFARIVDAKSPFTASHSSGVARVARALAERMGVSEAHCIQLEMAGLLHDLGKLRVPDEILEKPAPLAESERQIMNSHSFETLQILKKIAGFEDITNWAANHHEAPGGHGYPFGLDGATLPLEARILRVADIFQAMVQDRPYRQGLTTDAVIRFMNEQSQKGSVDATVCTVLLQHLDAIYAIARKPLADEVTIA